MRWLGSIILLFFISSCISEADLNSAKLSFFNSASNKVFSLIISDDFMRRHINSKPSKEHPKMTEAEVRLLTALLKENKYCINKNGKLSFKITSKQEKVYDVTFAKLIEQNYRARPVVPTIYFGQCL